jgi:hypothetical protein
MLSKGLVAVGFWFKLRLGQPGIYTADIITDLEV